MFDIKIAGGEVLDGTGAPVRRCDVGLAGDRISAVGDLAQVPARIEVPAAGCVVCPGFIDVHSHSDSYLLIEPDAPSKIRQGVTTEVVGQCGASAAPLQGVYKMPADWRDKPYPGTWHSVAEYRLLLETCRPAVNVVLLIGHNTLRAGVMGYQPRPATTDEIGRMKDLLGRSLDEGGRGLSTGLLYLPGRHAEMAEVWALAGVVAARGGIYASHMRSEGARLLDALRETIDVGRRSGVRVEVSHLKTAGRRNWPLLEGAFEIIEGAQREGLAVAADRYPYNAGSTDLDIILPDWALRGGPDEVLGRLQDSQTRHRIIADLSAERSPEDWTGIMIGSTIHPDHMAYRGRTIAEIAAGLDRDPAETVVQILLKDQSKTGAIFFGMSEENMWRILAKPYVMIGSDASIRSPEGPLSVDHPHPRAYGTFPRFLRAALDGKTVPLPEAVRKMTSLPAQHFNLRDRGVIAEGKAADLVVFDPGTVHDTATYAQPHQFAEGIRTVIVNGRLTLQDGQPTGNRGGQFLDS